MPVERITCSITLSDASDAANAAGALPSSTAAASSRESNFFFKVISSFLTRCYAAARRAGEGGGIQNGFLGNRFGI